MTLCPIALAVGCQKCPAFKICPLKGMIGDKPPAPVAAPEVKAGARAGSATKPRSAAARKKKK